MPPIVALAALIATFALTTLWIYSTFSDSEGISYQYMIGLNVLFFALYCIVLSIDIPWMELYSLNSFKLFTIGIIFVFTVIVAWCIISPFEALTNYIWLTGTVATMGIFAFRERIMKQPKTA